MQRVAALGHTTPMILRPYTAADAGALANIYRDAVLALGITAYSTEQVKVWASFAEDSSAFTAFLAHGHTVVAEIEGEPAAFCQRHPADHIALLYTAPRFARRGLATAAYRAIESHARAEGRSILTTDASKLSRPFFEREGFTVRRTEQTCRQGVYFERYQMEKALPPQGPSRRNATQPGRKRGGQGATP